MSERVVIVCGVLGTIERLRRLLKSVDAFLKPRPYFVVVGQGLDNTAARWVKRQGVHLIRKDEPLSFAQFNNLAIKETGDPQWILLLNDDLELKPSFQQGLAEMIDHNYDIAGAKLLYPEGLANPAMNGQKGNWIQHYGKWFTLDFYPFHVLRWQPVDHPASLQPRAFPDVSFACALIKGDVWRELGGLDESFSNGFEDDDFCLRAREIGAQIGVHHLMLATHWESQTTGMDNENKEKQWQLFHKNWIVTGRIQWPLGIHQGWKFP